MDKSDVTDPKLKALEKQLDAEIDAALLKFSDGLEAADLSGTVGAASIIYILLRHAYEVAMMGGKPHADIMRVFNSVFDRMGDIRAEVEGRAKRDIVSGAVDEYLKGRKLDALDIN